MDTRALSYLTRPARSAVDSTPILCDRTTESVEDSISARVPNPDKVLVLEDVKS